jgi:hypothetical protein
LRDHPFQGGLAHGERLAAQIVPGEAPPLLPDGLADLVRKIEQSTGESQSEWGSAGAGVAPRGHGRGGRAYLPLDRAYNLGELFTDAISVHWRASLLLKRKTDSVVSITPRALSPGCAVSAPLVSGL